MEDNKELVTDVTENVEEQATEELVDGNANATEDNTEEKKGKFYTDEELDELIKRKLGRQETKIRKEYDKKYGKLENVLRAGTGEDDIEKMTDTFAEFYTRKGIQIPTTPHYSQKEMEILAEAEANEIITAGYDEITDELNRLSDVGFDNMTASDKHIFLKLKQEADRITNEKELKSIGITELPEGFKEFADKFNPSLSLKEKYEMYVKLNPTKKGTPMGSMKNNTMKDDGVKEFYTYEEAIRFTKEDYDKNPELFRAVENSMSKWK